MSSHLAIKDRISVGFTAIYDSKLDMVVGILYLSSGPKTIGWIRGNKTLISGLLTPIGKTSREALISKEPTKFVVKICVNSRCNRFYQK
jgi:hypothetical protein